MLDTSNYSKGTQWCGPSAVALIARIPLREATELLTRISGGTYSELSGTWDEEVLLALYELGYGAREVNLAERYPTIPYGPTLKRYMRERPAIEKVMPTLIGLQNHFITSQYDMAGDNWTKRMVPFDRFPQPGRLVKNVYIIERRPS